MNSNYIENKINQINRLYHKIEDDVLDEYNKEKISKKEMINIIGWCEKMRENQKRELIEK